MPANTGSDMVSVCNGASCYVEFYTGTLSLWLEAAEIIHNGAFPLPHLQAAFFLLALSAVSRPGDESSTLQKLQIV